MIELKAVISSIPPSTNKLYRPITMKKGGRTFTKEVLSTEAKAYITSASLELGKQWMFSPKPKLNVPYELTLVFYLKKIEHKGWPAKTATRFVKRDVTNLIKVLEDIVSRASGVDDSCTFDLKICKRLAPQEPYVEVLLREMSDDEIYGER